MRSKNYNFNYSPPIYDFIISNMYLNPKKKEKEILEMCRNGEKCSAIAFETGFSERTIQRRRRQLDKRIKDAMIL